MAIVVLVSREIVLPTAVETRWLRDLPPDRYADLAHWPEARLRHCSLLGTRLLQDGMRRLGYAHRSLGTLQYLRNKRPVLDVNLNFSLSHCNGRVVCALSNSGAIGVDIEKVGTFTANEFSLYLNQRERMWAGTDPQRFYSLWTRKEAIAKAAGNRGLADLVHIDTQGAGDHAELFDQTWKTVEIPLGDCYSAHVSHRLQGELSTSLTIAHVPWHSLENPVEN